jgi:hypothetical protein
LFWNFSLSLSLFLAKEGQAGRHRKRATFLERSVVCILGEGGECCCFEKERKLLSDESVERVYRERGRGRKEGKGKERWRWREREREREGKCLVAVGTRKGGLTGTETERERERDLKAHVGQSAE